MSQLNYLEKLLDGVEVEWKLLEQLVVDKFWIMPATPKFNEGETIPYITSKNIKGGHISFDKTKFISREDYIELSRNRPILAGDFLISMIGTIGEVAVVKESDLAFYGQNMYLIRLDETVIMSRYFWHFFDSPRMKSHFQAVKNNSGQGYLKANNIDKLEIPIPCPNNPEKSLAIQAEIVRILDAFTAMTAELTAELNMRKKQYNYYRDQLLSFEEGDVEWKRLEEIGHIVTGRTPKSSDKSAWGDDVDFVTPSDIKNGMRNITCPSRRLSAEGAASMPKVRIPSGSLLVTCIGADMGKTVINANDCIPNQQINAITLTDDNVQVGYLFHVLTAMRETLRRQGELGGGTMPLINKSDFSKIVVPVPSYEEQNRIATILDKFDALTNSITEGLPREIELRQKQYEYYRDLLLSFPKSDEAA